MLAALEYRDLTPEDFPPGGDALPPAEQLQLIARALDRKRVACAHLMAVKLGFPWHPRGGRVEWALQRWLRGRK